ncbi:RNase P subunit RPR2 [Candidatus Methanoperedens nitroreducens]|uniref:Ribonuclease P protein component 4 n=1 Tax=Candidatus Methanoperedens nitratireducens TaxID=1392998 RepID=A0A062V364_9EURY|nr:ribonuclease P protein component 4 [Candidatus Methanoperedens nitroreducens]KCZ71797.1 RNase P subunit RPR2 [Candidatus Methanoperedens nitroreducens]MDJ1422229.1 ribonuclease P protein component 4 [Candidatus Methanoperedens sp.]
MRKKQKGWAKDMAQQRIIRLFELADHEFKAHPERSNRYVQLARRIAMRYRVRIPQELKQKVCKHCHAYLVQGVTARTRLQDTHITTTCLVCGEQMRRPY